MLITDELLVDAAVNENGNHPFISRGDAGWHSHYVRNLSTVTVSFGSGIEADDICDTSCDQVALA